MVRIFQYLFAGICCCLLSSCDIFIAEDQRYINSLISEENVTRYLQQHQWQEYRLFDSYSLTTDPPNGYYMILPYKKVWYFYPTRLYSITVNSSKDTIKGLWKFRPAKSLEIDSIYQPKSDKERYSRPVQGIFSYTGFSSSGGVRDTSLISREIVFITTQEFVLIGPSFYGRSRQYFQAVK